MSNTTVRKLTSHEKQVYYNAVSAAVGLAPPLVSGIAALLPVYDPAAKTAYVDQYCRVGLGPYFFNPATSRIERGVMLIHEALHILNNHLQRAQAANHQDRLVSNVAADCEINEIIKNFNNAEQHMKDWVLPATFTPALEPRKTHEKYYNVLIRRREEVHGMFPDHGRGGAQGNSGNDSGSQQGGDTGEESNGTRGTEQGGVPTQAAPDTATTPAEDTRTGGVQPKACQFATEAQQKAMDDAGVPRRSPEAVESVKRDVQQDIRTHIAQENAKSMGNQSGELSLYIGLLDLIRPPTLNWRSILAQVAATSKTNAKAGAQHTSYRRPSRRMAGLPDPRVILASRVSYEPTVMLGVDTSGSMSLTDYQNFLVEVSEVLRTFKSSRSGGIPIFSVDTKTHNPVMVRNLGDIRFTGGGGTNMAPAFAYVRSLGKRRTRGGRTEEPDLFVLATDGAIPWDGVIRELEQPHRYTPVILITDHRCFLQVPERAHELAYIVDCSKRN